MEGHVYHWKHGWIPLTHTAAMVKAKGNRHTAAKYADHYHIGDNRSEGYDRRQGGDLGPHERRRGDERGTFRYKPGTRTRDYPQRNPNGKGVTGPQTPGEAFTMKRAELEPHAKAGNVHAQAELDRRAAKHGKVPAAPKAAPAAKPLAHADDSELAREVHRRGGTVAGGKFLPGTAKRGGPVPERNPGLEGYADTELAAELHRRGGAVNAEGSHVPGGADTAARRFGPQDPNPDAKVPGTAAHDAETAAAMRGKTDAELTTLSKTLREGSTAHTQVLAEIDRRRSTRVAPPEIPPTPKASPAPAPHPTAPSSAAFEHGSPEHQAALAAEDRQIEAALPGSVIRSHAAATYQYGGGRTPHVYTTHSSTTGSYRTRQVGSVTSKGGTITAQHYTYTPTGKQRTPTDLGTFSSRLDAHKAIADAQTAHEAKTSAAAAKKAERGAKAQEKGLEASTRIAASARGINGTAWEAHTVDDGTIMGRRAASGVRYAFKNGNKKVVVEASMSEAEVTGLLNDTADVLERAHPNVAHMPVTVRVPKGDSNFRWSEAGGNTGGYVWSGDTTIHVNPVIARGEAKAASFGHQHAATHFMPANGGTHARAYVLTHELGHVIDGQNGHTRNGANVFQSFGTEATAMHREHMTGFPGKYGRKNPAEGYAEAFAQHQLGGVGSHPVSDAYAGKYGWHAPATTYVDPTGKAQASAARYSELMAAWERGTGGLGKTAQLRDATGAQLRDATKV